MTAAAPPAALGGAIAALLALGTATACDHTPQVGAVAIQHRPAHVDSVFPVEEELRRFRAALPDSADRLSGGAASLDELVARFIVALEAGDQTALRALVITPAEFAYLYYPHTRFTTRPYEMSPGLLWFQLENYGGRGLARALGRYGNRPLGAAGYVCPDAPTIQGPNRIWSGCLVRLTGAAGDTTTASLFGAVVGRDGVFKFLSYASRL